MGTILGIFGILKTFDFLKIFRRLDPTWNTGQKKFFEKSTPKHVQNTFGQFGKGFGRFWNFEKILNFLQKHFEDSTLHGRLGKKVFEKVPQNMFKTPLDNLGSILGVFGILKFFWFFKNISKTRHFMEHWAKKISEKITSKHVQNTFGHFWERFWAFLEFWKLLIFWKYFEDSTLHGTLGKKNFSKKVPQNMFKTLLDNLWKVLGVFGILKTFDFLKIFRRLDPTWNTGQKKIFEKVPQNMFKTLLDTFGNDLGIFAILKIFSIFENISKTLPSMEHWAKKTFEKNNPKTSSKHVWTLLGTILCNYEILKNFWFFENISKTRPSMEHWARKNFEKNYPKTCSKHVWTLLGTNLGIFGILKIFWFFDNISKTRPSMEHWAKKNFRKNYLKTCSKHVWTLLGTVLGVFGILKTFDFLKIFRRLDPPWNTGQKIFFQKNYPKTCSKHFWTIWERFWAFLEFWKLFNFLQKHFEDSTLHGTLGKKIFGKLTTKHVQNTFGNLGTTLGIFGILKNF